MEFFAATALMLTINLLIVFQSGAETLRLDVVRYSVLASSFLLFLSLIVGGFTAGYLLDVAETGQHRETAIRCAKLQWWTFVFGVVPLLFAVIGRIGFG
jgi:glucan phosphoethanolaminetransferase (alkaline phosphatase superfamily)